MRFKKINDKSIKCYISQEELDEQGMHIDDLMDDRAKAETFLRYILQQAKYEVDFDTNGEALNVQLSILPDGDIQLMISDDRETAIRGMLSELGEKMKSFTESLETKKKELETSSEKTTDVTDEDVDAVLDTDFWAVFSSMEEAILLSKKIAPIYSCDSCLYKYHDSYYLALSVSMTRRELAGLAFIMAEYSSSIYMDNPGMLQLSEHGELILPRDAVYCLSSL